MKRIIREKRSPGSAQRYPGAHALNGNPG